MAKRSKKTVLEAATAGAQPPVKELSLQEERFVEYYLLTGNAALSARKAGYSIAAAKEVGYRLLTYAHISDAVESAREEQRQRLAYDRTRHLEALVAMFESSLEDFTEVLKDPESKESFRGLGLKRHAIKNAQSSFKNGNKIELVDKIQVMNELWDKLGLSEATGKGNWFDGLEHVVALVRKVKGEQ